MATANRGFLNAFQLKLLMVILMVLDHLYYNLVPQLYWGHVAARVVAPVFCFLVTEGMVYTRNRRRYILRLLAFALFMLVGNGLLYALYGRWIDNSILMSLAIAAAMIACADRAGQTTGMKKLLWVLAIAALILASLFFEGAYMMPLMGAIFYYMRDRPAAMWLLYFVAFCLPYLGTFVSTGVLQTQFWMILAILPIGCYSGQQGPNNTAAKYFFYVFYPLHIWVIFLLEQYLL